MSDSCDLAIVGGGLAGCLIALALRRARPVLDVRIIEAGEHLGGNHVWSFFGSDVTGEGAALIAPLISHRWPGYHIAFPAHARDFAEPYHSIRSAQLDAVVRDAIPAQRIMTGRAVSVVTATSVAFDDGATLAAGGVIDARGPGDLAQLEVGWQKFVGHELRLAAPHGLDRPIVMDATVEQVDGYRFVYSLPFAPDRVFVEDTYYSDTPDLDVPAIADRIAAYAAGRGWQVTAVTSRETGVLPVTLDGDFAAYWRSTGEGVAKAGMRAALFHPTTGYSLPNAVRLATAIARADDLSGAALARLTQDYARRVWNGGGFYRMLDKMLFRAATPPERYRVLERFYRLSPALIGRFYAGKSTLADKARILTGKPPVPIGRAIRAIVR